MRTTVTLEDELAVLLGKRRSERGQIFQEALNEALRNGLVEHAASPMPGRRAAEYEFKSFDLGRPLMENMDNVHEVLAAVEGEDHR
ncbi:hypothetical protein [Haloactinomyces albus]|uniref:DUF2191 domain-containing protein n=1 Tax=Haloactinomyces albus TaxID=1352928 RepID=A0AAE3ZEC0_9ACTN|nr:hypothetical protein [Haloactinomyces albus]MDR7302093.1 hypothetical protein [Haloactinomyces albus]